MQNIKQYEAGKLQLEVYNQNQKGFIEKKADRKKMVKQFRKRLWHTTRCGT